MEKVAPWSSPQLGWPFTNLLLTNFCLAKIERRRLYRRTLHYSSCRKSSQLLSYYLKRAPCESTRGIHGWFIHMRSSCPSIRAGRVVFALTILLLILVASQGYLDTFAYHGATFNSASESPARFAIISMTTSETTYDYLSFSNKHVYAAKHGYDLVWDFEPSRHYLKVWEKLNLTRDAIGSSLFGHKTYEWVWMLDYDTLITNSSIPISAVIQQSLDLAEEEGKSRADVNLILARDCDPLNLGSMFLRVSSWTLDFIEQWRAGAGIPDAQGKPRNEQDVLRDMLHLNEYSVADRSVIAPQWMFDAYPEELECYDPRNPKPWEPGMFLLHFAGAKWRLKDQKDPIGTLMRKYSLQVV